MMTTRAMSQSTTHDGSSGSKGAIAAGVGGADMPASGSAAATTKTRTTITSDPGILCFHHCNVKVFCFTLPHICPQCKTPLDPNGTGTTTATTRTSPTKQGGNYNKTPKKQRAMANAGASGVGGQGRLQLSNNGDVDNVDNIHDETADADTKARYVLNGHHDTAKQDKETNGENEDQRDNDEVDEDDNDDDDADDDGSNENSFVCNIMASRLLPFRLPYPFVRANQYPCAIVLRPTTGDFLNDYNNTTDLHIAVTTSTGCVVEFDRHGLRRHRTDKMADWRQCLLVGDVPEPWYDYWDQILFQICQQPDKWTVSHYHEDKHNCYTFVLTFLQALTYDKLSEAAGSKTTFCERYIVPRTTTAGKYISLYRKLRDTGIYVHHTNHHRHPHQHHNKLRHAVANGNGGGGGGGGRQQLLGNKLSNTAMGQTMAAPQSLQQKHQQQHQQQQQHQLQHHHSIIARPHPTLCTIEE